MAKMAKKDAIVLAINDGDDARANLVTRIYAAEIGAVVAPSSYQALADDLARRPTPYSLIILDYDLEGWGFQTIGPILSLLRSHPASSGAPLVVLTAFAEYAMQDSLLNGIEIIDAVSTGADEVRDIIRRYIP